MSDSEETFGPALPPGFQKTPTPSSTKEGYSSSAKIIGSALASASKIPNVDSETEDSDLSSSDSETEPQHSKVIGPARPEGHLLGPALQHEVQDEGSIGPALPPGFVQSRDHSSDTEEGIGPVPPVPGQQGQGLSAAEEFEERARKMKYKLIHGVKIKLFIKSIFFLN